MTKEENPLYVRLRELIAQAWTGQPYGPGNKNSCDAVMEAIWDEIDKLQYKADSAVSTLEALGVTVMAEDDHFEVVVPAHITKVLNT